MRKNNEGETIKSLPPRGRWRVKRAGRSLRVRTQSTRFMASATLKCRGLLPTPRLCAELPSSGRRAQSCLSSHLWGSPLPQKNIWALNGRPMVAPTIKTSVFSFFSSHFQEVKNISTFFKKGVDKAFSLWYNTCVIQRQQVPVKADAFLPRRWIESLFVRSIFLHGCKCACRKEDFFISKI